MSITYIDGYIYCLHYNAIDDKEYSGNPIISDVFHRLKFMERRGSGLKKILKEYEPKNLPEFYSDQQYFTVTLMNKNYVQEKATPETILKKIREVPASSDISY